jgi:hypothetical protein
MKNQRYLLRPEFMKAGIGPFLLLRLRARCRHPYFVAPRSFIDGTVLLLMALAARIAASIVCDSRLANSVHV